MQIYAVFTPDGDPAAFYNDDVHGARLIDGAENPNCTIPADAVEITEAQWREFLVNPGQRRWCGSDVVEHQPAVDLAASLTAYTMARRDELIDGGFTFGGVGYQSRATDRENILGAALMASLAIAAGAQPGNFRWADPASDFGWIALDNSVVNMDAQTVVAFGNAQAARKQELIFKARAIKDQIASGIITSTAEIDAAFG